MSCVAGCTLRCLCSVTNDDSKSARPQVRQVRARLRCGGQRDADDVFRVRVRLPAAALDTDLVLSVPEAQLAAVLHHVLVVLLDAAVGRCGPVEDETGFTYILYMYLGLQQNH